MVDNSWSTLQITSSHSDAAAEVMFVSSSKDLAVLKRIGFAAELGQSFDLAPLAEDVRRILVLGLGGSATLTADQWLSMGGFLFEAMRTHRIATVRLPPAASIGGPQVLQKMLLGALLHSYMLDRAGNTRTKSFVPQGLIVNTQDQACIEAATRSANAVNRARAWVERPANLLTPPIWAEEARQLFVQRGAHVKVLGPEELAAMGAGALLAVARGSEHGPRLLAVEWRGTPAREGWDAVLVGKGLTFDTGGLNLKPRPNLSKMKLDMAGGAAVLGAVELAIARESRANVVALVPIAENAIDALSFRPGDVVTSLSGLTIEVADTDAEGRLVLADAMTYGLRHYQPTWMIDAATLTTAVTAVLHEEFAAVYASDDVLARTLIEAGEVTGERLWRMPLEVSQAYLADSAVADVCNLGAPGFFGRGDGSPTAGAQFLERFAPGVRWAHIDMCGTAWSTRRTSLCGPGATGYGVRLLDQWLSILEAQEVR